MIRSKQMQELKNHEINFEVDLKSMENSDHTKDFYGTSPYTIPVGVTPYIVERENKDKEKILEGI